jgi:hypothetical protein
MRVAENFIPVAMLSEKDGLWVVEDGVQELGVGVVKNNPLQEVGS